MIKNGQKTIVNFSFQKKYGLKHRLPLKESLRALFIKEKKIFNSLSYIFCSDDFLLKINEKFLDHSDFTDIITFNLSEDGGIEGEIYISIDRIKENAKSFQVSTEDEMLRVIFHGALHLCGYSDKGELEKLEMRKKEDYYLQKHKLADHYVPRGTSLF